MTPEKITVTRYRQRGYKCPSCGITIMVFGNDPLPMTCRCAALPANFVLEWDNLVNETKIVTPYESQEQPAQ